MYMPCILTKNQGESHLSILCENCIQSIKDKLFAFVYDKAEMGFINKSQKEQISVSSRNTGGYALQEQLMLR